MFCDTLIKDKEDILDENIIISGTSSGLGNFLKSEFKATPFKRDCHDIAEYCIKKKPIIIHSAFNSDSVIKESKVYEYLSDNITLTDKLVSIPHKKFIYISTIDVYKDKVDSSEAIELMLRDNLSFYTFTKLASEAIVKEKSANYLILRCSALLGQHIRKNSLLKILYEKKCKISIHQSSDFNFILHKDVASFINYAIRKDLNGIYNVASSKNINIEEIARMFKKKIEWGAYQYNAGNIDNRKISSVCPLFRKTSRDVVIEFISEMTEKP